MYVVMVRPVSSSLVVRGRHFLGWPVTPKPDHHNKNHLKQVLLNSEQNLFEYNGKIVSDKILVQDIVAKNNNGT